jgi:excisionase family DNA binding protein
MTGMPVSAGAPSERRVPIAEEGAALREERLLITLEEAARRLSVGRTTLYELAARGELQTVTIGRCRRVPLSSLNSFVERLTSEGSPEREEVEQVDAGQGPAPPTHPRRTMKGFLGRGRS